MYTPTLFEITEQAEIIRFIRHNSFGQLISVHAGRLLVSHLPFMFSEDERYLLCHVARENPQWQSITQQEIMLTFQGPHGYISPSWYQTPGVPTWNYQTAHVYGRANIIEDIEQLRSLVAQLTAVHESDSTTQLHYRDAVLGAIVGIEIGITEIQCKYKLSQNRPRVDQEQVIEQLERQGTAALAEAMKKHL